MNVVGSNIRKIRKEKGYSLRGLGKKINVAHSHLSRIETGEKNPNLELLKTLSLVFDVSISSLVGEEYSKDEKKFMDDVKRNPVTIKDLAEKYNIIVGDRPATEDEINEAVKYILAKRIMDES